MIKTHGVLVSRIVNIDDRASIRLNNFSRVIFFKLKEVAVFAGKVLFAIALCVILQDNRRFSGSCCYTAGFQRIVAVFCIFRPVIDDILRICSGNPNCIKYQIFLKLTAKSKRRSSFGYRPVIKLITRSCWF